MRSIQAYKRKHIYNYKNFKSSVASIIEEVKASNWESSRRSALPAIGRRPAPIEPIGGRCPGLGGTLGPSNRLRKLSRATAANEKISHIRTNCDFHIITSSAVSSKTIPIYIVLNQYLWRRWGQHWRAWEQGSGWKLATPTRGGCPGLRSGDPAHPLCPQGCKDLRPKSQLSCLVEGRVEDDQSSGRMRCVGMLLRDNTLRMSAWKESNIFLFI